MKPAWVLRSRSGRAVAIACVAVTVAACGAAAGGDHAAGHGAARQRDLAAQLAPGNAAATGNAARAHTGAGHTGAGHSDAAHAGSGQAAKRRAHVAPAPHARTQAAPAPAYFRTVPPGKKLPSGAQCATWVRARAIAENKGVNRRFNHTTGQHVGSKFLSGDQPQADRLLVPRIDGHFTGTTEQILRWAACKWGIAQNVVFAQAAVESWWRQTTKGDWESNGCPPGHGPGADGKKGLCPQSWGILQNRYPFEKSSWPGIAKSTAMNADTAYAIWRSCFDGYETWLNTVTHVGKYHGGDLWGCVGRWFDGRWHTGPAQQYIAKVKQYMRERIWTTRDFQQP